MRAAVASGSTDGNPLAPRADDLIVYSCVTRGYDEAVAPVEPCNGRSYICFSNDPELTAPGWTMRPLRSPPHIRHPRLVARYHKAFAHELFPDNRWSVWVDGNIRWDMPLEAAVDALERSGLAIAAFIHPAGRDVGEEFDACWRWRRFLPRDKWRAFAQVRYFERERFPLHIPITENRVVVRDHHHTALGEMMTLLWSMLTRFTSRDQLSLQYCIWKLSEAILLLDSVDGFSYDLLTITPHSRGPRSIARSIAYRLLRLRALSPRPVILHRRIETARRAIAEQTATAVSYR